MKAQRIVGWTLLAILVAVAIWLLASGRRTPADALAVLNWVVPLIVGYLLGMRTERRRHRKLRQSRRERRSPKS
jgi:hypothetical protein